MTDIAESTGAATQVKGVRWATAAAEIRAGSAEGCATPDVALMEIAAGSVVSAVFTQNAFCAAPVHVARAHLDASKATLNKPLYCLINAGNANAGTGVPGMRAAKKSCQALADVVSGNAEQVLPFSTGVIGELLPVEKIEAVLPTLHSDLARQGWEAAAQAIMTTDTVPKLATATLDVDDQIITVAGISKGAGMIKPNMATMLAYIATDAGVEQSELDGLLTRAVSNSFNRITVDGDTSTNDACVLAATCQSGLSLDLNSPHWESFSEAVIDVLQDLAVAIIRDAEGASKFVTLDILNGNSSEECLKVAYAVAESPLVKTAFFASDANWGRILAAVGRAGVENLDANNVTIALDGYVICANGGRVDGYSEDKASAIMAQDEITISIDLARGSAAERVWTSDLSHDYVRINAEYRT